jgi:hypothetical protein
MRNVGLKDSSRANNETAPVGTADPVQLQLARKTLDILTHHRDSACMRDEGELKKLADEERKAWQSFWAEVAALLRNAEKP